MVDNMKQELNKTYQVTITSQNHEGDGVARINDLVVFVPGGVVEDVLEIKITKVYKNYMFGKIKQIITPSKYRIKPLCPIFGLCGGCEIMHYNYQYQLQFKKQLVIDALTRIAGLNDIEVCDVVGMDEPYYYRNKVQVPFGKIKNQVVCGFYKKNSHEIIPFNECYIQPKCSTEIVKFIRDFAKENNISIYNEQTHEGILRHVMIRSNSFNQYMVTIVTNSIDLPSEQKLIKKLTNTFPEIVSIVHNINLAKTNVILGTKYRVIFGKDELIEEILGLKFLINHQSFLQVNYKQTLKMYQTVIDLLKPTKDDVYIDAFCGVGTISLLLAKYAKKVYGIEIVKEAIDSANRNKRLNMMDNSEFILGKSEEEIYKMNLDNVSGIVVDPPRKGCEQTFLERIIETKIPKIVYVSCNVSTLARDLKVLKDYYRVEKVVPFDLFSQTAHVSGGIDVAAVALILLVFAFAFNLSTRERVMRMWEHIGIF